MQDSKIVEENQQETAHLDSAEKNVAKFLDSYIDKNPEKMRALMSDSFQASYDFEKMSADRATQSPISFRILRVSKEAGSYNVVAEVLFENVKNGKQKTSEFIYGLVELDGTKKLLINTEKPNKAKQPFYKKPLFWVVAIIAVAAVVAGLLWYGQNKKTTQNQQSVTASWQEITAEANAVNVLGDKAAQDKSAFNDYSKELLTFVNLLSSKKYAADQLVASSADKNDISNYKNALMSMSDYIQEAANQSNSIEDYSTADNTKLTTLAETAQSSVNNFQNNAKYLKNQMPQKIYDITNVLTKVKDQINAVNEQDQAAKDAAAAAAAQDAANKTTVTNNITTFEQGFIAGNANTMRPVMTTGFQGEYNFNQLAPDQRQFQYPSSFRIINVTKQADNTYKAQVNVLYKYTDNTNQYTQGYTYSVISSNNKWLINNEAVGNSF